MNARVRPSFSWRPAALALAAAVALGAPALAAGLTAHIGLPQGLTPAQNAPVNVTFTPANDPVLTGAKVTVMLEGGANGSSQQVILKGASGAYTGQLHPDSPGRYRVSVSVSSGGRHYANVQTIDVPTNPGSVTTNLPAPITRASVPVLQIAAWVIGSALFGLVALRGVGAFD
ncbi:MAG TPA: hypothetical protein VHN99_04125 [Deinococcales bacterium]|nr:hypothetical protein [Deinococcales bacterium]